MIPNIAAWGQGQIDNALGAAGTSAAKVGEKALEANSVMYHGLLILGSGAVLVGMVLGAVTAFIVDRKFIAAGAFLLGGVVLTFFGIINAEKVEFNANATVELGYLFAAIICFAFAFMRLPVREKEADEIALDEEEGMSPPPAADIEPIVASEAASAGAPR